MDAISGPADPDFASVVSLMHFDGADGSTTITDETGKVWTPGGNAQVNAGTLLLDGAGDYITTPHHVDFDFGSGDFTVEMTVNLVSASPNQILIAMRNSAGYSPFLIYVNNVSKLQVNTCNSSGTWGTILTDTAVVTAGVDLQVALVRSGTTITLYVNGTSVASGAIAGSLMASTDPLAIGYWAFGGGWYLNGRVDEVRVTKGVARYTGNYAPSVTPFPDA